MTDYDRRKHAQGLWFFDAWPMTTRVSKYATVPCFLRSSLCTSSNGVRVACRAHYPGKVNGVRWYSMTATADTPSDTPSPMSAPDSSTQQPAPAPVSGPSAHPSVASVPVSTPTETEQNEIDPAVAPLVAMFPDFDPNVLEAVYLSNNRDQNAAIEALLSMSNPEVSWSFQSAAHTWTSFDVSCSISHLLNRYFRAHYKSLELS